MTDFTSLPEYKRLEEIREYVIGTMDLPISVMKTVEDLRHKPWWDEFSFSLMKEEISRMPEHRRKLWSQVLYRRSMSLDP